MVGGPRDSRLWLQSGIRLYRCRLGRHVAAERLDLSAVPRWKLHAVKAAIIALSAALAAPLGCARSGPVRPSQRATLVIRPEIDGIIVNEREQLSAWLVGEGPDQEVIVDWTTDDSSILGVDHQGLVTAERFGTATVRASRDALQATRTLDVVPRARGFWSGEARIAECDRVSGAGPNTCGAIIGLILPLELVLEQSGSRLDGTLTIYSTRASGPVAGQVTPSLLVTLTGSLRQAGEHPEELDLLEWSTNVDPIRPRITGRYRVRRTFTNGFGMQVQLHTHEILRLIATTDGSS